MIIFPVNAMFNNIKHKMTHKTHDHKFRIFTFFILFLILSTGRIALAQSASNNLDKPFGEQKDIVSLTQTIFEFGIAACVLAAAIYIAWGALHYFYAAGDAKQAGEAKEIISRAITGLVLALISWIILNTIHPQFADELSTPKPSGILTNPVK